MEYKKKEKISNFFGWLLKSGIELFLDLADLCSGLLALVLRLFR